MSSFNLKEDLTWRDILIRAAIVIGTVAIISYAMPRDSQSYYLLEAGKPWKYADLTAPFDFPIYKTDEMIQQEKDSLMRDYQPYFDYLPDVGSEKERQFVSDFKEGIEGLTDDYISIIANRIHNLYASGIISSSEYTKNNDDSTSAIRIVNGKNAISVYAYKLFTTKEAYEQLLLDPLLEPHRAILQGCNLNEYIVPNLIYDEERSEQSLNDLLSSIPQSSGIVQKGQKIIGRGEIVSEETYRILVSYQKENVKRNRDVKRARISTAGETLFVAILMICFTIYLTLFRKDYFDKARNTAMLYTLIIVFSLITAVMVRNSIIHVYIIPYAIVPIFARIFLDSRTAFITHFTMILICACMLQYPFEFIIVESVAGISAIYSLRELQYRSQLFKTALLVTLSAMAVNLSFDLMSVSDLSELDSSYYKYLIVNGGLLLFTYPLLYLVEKTFGFTSDITLIELSNTNNRLLRRLSELAPGTFQHSIQVGNLAADIANKIGANAQLVRTGALYHDIGKMHNPIYFTENQAGIDPHENLSYIDSAQMIISHVTEGLQMAEKENLPAIIRDFISTHHGQGKTKYFYIKYKNAHPDEDVDDLLFTYPGPNPFTREQAILMIADSVEAASRSLPDYTEKTLHELVDKIVDTMVEEGYFHECPITYRDITHAKTALVEKLKTIYHTRISYPTLTGSVQ